MEKDPIEWVHPHVSDVFDFLMITWIADRERKQRIAEEKNVEVGGRIAKDKE